MTSQDPALPSLRQLWRATGLAALAAGAILLTVILPAEYGIDPTGAGRALGLFRPAPAASFVDPATGSDSEAGASSPSGVPLLRSKDALRADEMSLVLQSGEGAEIKAEMAQGQHFVFSWTATGGAVDVDMHGEAFTAQNDEFTSYWKEDEQSGDQGAFVAPVSGRHGWFWQNLNDEPVTIKLTTTGFYARLMRP
jgi:hypothetical protein